VGYGSKQLKGGGAWRRDPGTPVGDLMHAQERRRCRGKPEKPGEKGRKNTGLETQAGGARAAPIVRCGKSKREKRDWL